MRTLNDYELKEIRGGFSSKALWIGLASFITFVIGVVDGYMRGLPCNK